MTISQDSELKSSGFDGDYEGFGAADKLLLSADTPGQHPFQLAVFSWSVLNLGIALGYNCGVLNGALVRIKDEMSMTTWQTSMIMSATPLMFIFAAPLAGAFADAYGRKVAMMITCCALSAGPCAMALVSHMWQLIVTRLVVGFGIGMGVVILSTYVAELAPSKFRGQLLTLSEVFQYVGMLLGYMLDYLLAGIHNDWRWMLGIGAIPSGLCLLGVLTPAVPESPRWLFMQGHTTKAKEVLANFLSAAEAKSTYSSMMCQSLESSDTSWRHFFATCKEKGRRRALLTSICLGIANTSCGSLVMGYYYSTVLSHTMSEQGAFMATFVMGVVRLVSGGYTILVLEKVGRRPMILISTMIQALASAWFACSFVWDLGWFAQSAGVSLFMAGYCMGLGPLTLVFISEVLSTEVRAKGVGFSLFFSRIAGFSSTLLFPILLDIFGYSMVFLLQAVVGLIFFMVLSRFIVETNGMRLEEMEKLFQD